MSKSVRVRPEQFQQAVIKALGEYGDEVNEKLEVLLKSAARETRAEIKSTAPENTGRYAAGWSNKAQKAGRYNLKQTVYNRTDYQLTHLLEKPHITWNGGKYPSKKDHTGILERIEKEQTNKFYEEVVDSL